jgi:hypothetical protein
MVEIDPLLAYQITVSSVHVATHSPADLAAQINSCLPLAPPAPKAVKSRTMSSVVFVSDDMNDRIVRHGLFDVGIQAIVAPPLRTFVRQLQVGGPAVGVGAAFVHVARVQGVCILSNGYHRACAMRRSGATHVPCIFRDTSTFEEAGVREDGGTLGRAKLLSPSPPTVGHFTQGRAKRRKVGDNTLSVLLVGQTRKHHLDAGEILAWPFQIGRELVGRPNNSAAFHRRRV